jgi:hypothetical protein
MRPRQIIGIPLIASPQEMGGRACRMRIKLADLEQMQRVTNAARKGIVINQNFAVLISLYVAVPTVALNVKKVRSNVGLLVVGGQSYRSVAPGLPSGLEC